LVNPVDHPLRAVTSFYYGNLTYPSQDPPRMGFVSTVPDNANDLFADAISNAAIDSGIFPAFSVEPPSRAPSGLAGYGGSLTLPTGLKAGVPASTSSAAPIAATVAPSTTDTPQTSQVAPNPAPSPSQSAKHSGASALTITSSLRLSLIAGVASILLLGH
jgi:hypothetical protein